MSLIEEEKDLANTNLQVAEAPVEEQEQEQIDPVVEKPTGTVPRVGESEGFVDAQLVSQAPIVNDTKMPAEGFVSAGMSGPVVEKRPEVVQEGPKVNQVVSDIDSTIPIEEPIQTEPLSTNEIYSSEIVDTGVRKGPTNEELLGPQIDAIEAARREESRQANIKIAKARQIDTASILLLGEINPDTGKYEGDIKFTGGISTVWKIGI